MRLISPRVQEDKRHQKLDWRAPAVELARKVGELEASRVMGLLRNGLTTVRRIERILAAQFGLGAEEATCESMAHGCVADASRVLVEAYDKDFSVALWVHLPPRVAVDDAARFKLPTITGYYSPMVFTWWPRIGGGISIAWSAYK